MAGEFIRLPLFLLFENSVFTQQSVQIQVPARISMAQEEFLNLRSRHPADLFERPVKWRSNEKRDAVIYADTGAGASGEGVSLAPVVLRRSGRMYFSKKSG